jgi:pimeloyl-ACP methyl ester carboxylesterase
VLLVSTFCLVHGAWHGAWCWERLVPELEAAGHRVVTVDLPSEDTSVAFSGYADVVVAALEDVDDDIVLVGHSLGGLTVPLVAAKRPVAHLVFLCALLPVPGKAFRAQFETDADILTPDLRARVRRDGDSGLSWWDDEQAATAVLYQHCSAADAHAAFARLRRQATTPHAEACPLEALPDVERTYVLAHDDNGVNPDWSRRAAPERLGVSPIEIGGDHSPFLARPAELARLLAGLA